MQSEAVASSIGQTTDAQTRIDWSPAGGSPLSSPATIFCVSPLDRSRLHFALTGRRRCLRTPHRHYLRAVALP